MSGQTGGQIGLLLDAEIRRRDLTNEDAARLMGVPERQIRRWRKNEVQPSRRSRRLILGWMAGDSDPEREAA